jgi:hypothetical protein
MSAITIFLGRLVGLYLVAISGGMLANRRRTLATLDEMARSGPWTLFSGMVATAGGLAVVLGHQVWSGGALRVFVTLVSWAALLEGMTLLLVPAERIAAAYKAIGFKRFFHVWMVANAVEVALTTLKTSPLASLRADQGIAPHGARASLALICLRGRGLIRGRMRYDNWNRPMVRRP